MGRLVITDVLMRRTKTINMIIHQGMETIICFKVCSKNTQLFIFPINKYNLHANLPKYHHKNTDWP